MIKKILFTILILQPLLGFSQIPQLSDKAVFSILTVGVSNESHTLYGHTALRVKDSVAGFDVVYNYGMFDFRTPNFLLKFTKGDLQYYAAVYPYADFEYSYREENRSIYEQKLNLSLSEKLNLFQKLNQSVFTEEKYYTYKFIDRNCTTKVIEVVNSVLQDKPIKNTVHQSESYREVLYGYQQDQCYLNLGINIIFGHRPDEQAKVLFLPLDLMEVLKTTQHNGTRLAENPQTLFEAQAQAQRFSFFNSILPLSILLLMVVIINKKGLNHLYLIMMSLVGLFLFAVSLYSEHREVLWNYNILLFNPLYLVLVYFMIKKNTIWAGKVALICFLGLAAYLFYMINKVHVSLLLPFIIATGTLLLRLYFKEKTSAFK